MTDTANFPGESSEPIGTDTPCRRCGYNLRGLLADGQCPECGTLVRLSLRKDLLEHSDPAWLDSLRRGVGWMLWYATGWVVFIVLLFFLHAQRMQIPAGILTAMYAWGRYLVTKPDPSGLGEAEYGTARRVVRFTILISIVGLPLAPIRSLVVAIPELLLTITVLQAVVETASIVGIFAQLQYFQKLLLRIPEYELSQRARFLKYALGISGGILMFVVMVMQLGGRSALRRGLRTGVVCTGGLAIVPLMIFVVMYLNLLGKLSARLRQLSDVAQKSWSAPV
jgi:hypothetical protein